MNTIERFSYTLGSALLWLIFALGGLVTVVIVPIISNELTLTYSEYTNDRAVIQIMLTMPVVLGMVIVLAVLLLLRLIHKDRILSVSAYKWVRGLSFSAFGLAASLFAIGSWLNFKNTLPPLIAITLTAGALVALAVGFVTLTLMSLLKRATTAIEELEGVI